MTQRIKSEWETVRMAPEIVAELEAHESEPVVVASIHRHDDGTLELIFRRLDFTTEHREGDDGADYRRLVGSWEVVR